MPCIAPVASRASLRVFLLKCRKLQLSVCARQIHGRAISLDRRQPQALNQTLAPPSCNAIESLVLIVKTSSGTLRSSIAQVLRQRLQLSSAGLDRGLLHTLCRPANEDPDWNSGSQALGIMAESGATETSPLDSSMDGTPFCSSLEKSNNPAGPCRPLPPPDPSVLLLAGG
ncbi:hypothetical protein BT67DRAFT_444038 [Trichocladium antarcticum]|uniref:Uncharacterized protein n=1 Tax=Trichocladium antarcticum TaxID=1450529 RepID=A0AAN6ZCA6_9PEZI|nr:hypothetical protein BT67DRAFT_444038 [Trichocladium antarcticum]